MKLDQPGIQTRIISFSPVLPIVSGLYLLIKRVIRVCPSVLRFYLLIYFLPPRGMDEKVLLIVVTSEL